MKYKIYTVEMLNTFWHWMPFGYLVIILYLPVQGTVPSQPIEPCMLQPGKAICADSFLQLQGIFCIKKSE